MPRARTFEFTDRALRALPVPPKPKQLDYFDIKVRGLGLRVSYGSSKAFFVLYGPAKKRQRLTLGKYGQLSLAKARRLAKVKLGGIADGDDPAGEARARRRAATIGAIADDWIERQQKTGRKSWRWQQRLIERDILPEIGDVRGCDLTRGEVKAMLRRIAERPAPILHNRALEIGRAMLGWALRQDEYNLEYNPFAGIERYEEVPRERWLNETELGAYWEALVEEPEQRKADALRLCLLTAQRQANVLALHTDQLMLKDRIWLVPASTTKTRRTYKVPLSGLAVSIIEGLLETAKDGWHFPNHAGTGPINRESSWLKQAHRQACEQAGIEGYTLHDARRTFGSHADTKFSRLVWDGILGHVSATMADVYSGHDFAEQRLQCVEWWAARILAAASDNVVKLERPA
jgi:integrase